MAEAIGLVSGILALLEFGCKVVSGTRGLREARHGLAPDVHELDLIMKQIESSHHEYRGYMSARKKQLSADDNTLAIMEQCEQLRKELSKVIERLRIPDNKVSKTLDVWIVSIRKIRKDKYLINLRDRILKLDQLIRDKIMREMKELNHASIMAELRDTEKEKMSLGIVSHSALDLIKAEIMDIIGKSSSMQSPAQKRVLENSFTGPQKSATASGFLKNKGVDNQGISDEEAEEQEMQLATRVQLLTNSIVKLKVLQREQDSSKREVAVIRSLYFKEVFRRFEKIPEADPDSNEWVFDPTETTFSTWLGSKQENDGLYYIFGKAGSGKSTLMKFISESTRTRQLLNQWAGTSKMYPATYYFWNQGSEMQKSGLGLFQSLLYQILRTNPALITPEWGTRSHHEVWTMKELRAAFEEIANSTKLQSKFCFFIDGLDEYEGEEEDLSKMLDVLAAFKHIKICASSRPHRQYEEFLKRENRTFDIADFTKADLENHARRELGLSKRFQALAAKEPDCAKIITDISNWASGVWLWVFLVTSEIRKEAEKGEGIETLRNIVDEFPSDLERFFTRIIEKVKLRHKGQMAQIFLIAVEELQPLPLYAFALLEQERTKPHFEQYAVKAKREPFDEFDLKKQYPDLKKRLQNRCGDLLVVDNKPHPVYLSHSVDFLHRTVRDFLRDSYRKELEVLSDRTFNPLISLSNICLALLKGSEVESFRSQTSLKTIFGLTDELLYYARELERRFGDPVIPRLIPILDELDKTNTAFAKKKGGSNHWTNARDLVQSQGIDIYKEGGNCSFLALAVQARLVGYVRAKLQEDPRNLVKNGRPLLDYALRPLRTTPIAMPYHSIRDDPSVDIEMVTLLLENGADPNQPVYIYDRETVWGLFLKSMCATEPSQISSSLLEAWFRACRALIRAGARTDYMFVQSDAFGPAGFSVPSVFDGLFSHSEVAELRTEIAKKEAENLRQQLETGWWGGLARWVGY